MIAIEQFTTRAVRFGLVTVVMAIGAAACMGERELTFEECVEVYDLYAVYGPVVESGPTTIASILEYSNSEFFIADGTPTRNEKMLRVMSERCKMALEDEMLRRQAILLEE